MKKMILVMLSSSLLVFQAQATLKELVQSWTKTQTYGKNDESGTPFLVGFELGNKGKDPLWIQVVNGNELSEVVKVDPLGKSNKARADFIIDTAQPTYLAIWHEESPGVATQDPAKLFSFSKNKTIYVTWESNGLRPTKGKLAGILDKTDSNMSLRNNVSTKDIYTQGVAAKATALQKIRSAIE
jgi:hypothetical protein